MQNNNSLSNNLEGMDSSMKSYRKLAALCLTAALAAGMAIPAAADVSPVTVTVNGKTASTSAYINSDWRTMVPVETADAMGVTYTVSGDSVTFTANGVSQTYTVGSAVGDTVPARMDGTIYVPFYHLAETFGYQVSWDSAAGGAAAKKEQALPTAQDITSIQATTAPNFYGHKVSTVAVTYKAGTDLSGVTLNDYTIYDRGFDNPDFGEITLVDISVSGNTVTLYADQGSDKVTDRSRETYGTLCTSSKWYVDSQGVIHCDDPQNGEEAGSWTDRLGITIEPNIINKGLQWRENMDLILCVNGASIQNGIASTDGAGKMLKDTVWKETVLGGGLDEVKLEMVSIGQAAPNYTMLGSKGEVPVYVIYPEGYDASRAESYPAIVYQCGGGVCYWEVTDGSATAANNLGCNVVYDEMMTKWHEEMPEAIIMSVNVHSNPIDVSAAEIAGVLDYSIENWNVDKDGIIIVGNSQGTLISSDVIRQRPDLIAGFVECNGNLGSMTAAAQVDGTLANSSLGTWTAEEVQAMIDNEVAVWMFNGETDGDNPAAQQDVIEVVKELYRTSGKDETWISEHVRASGLQSWKFKNWGETDHSVTKVVASFYLDTPYADVWEGQDKLTAGSTYTYTGKEEGYANYALTKDYEYIVYPESVSDWVRAMIG